MTKIRILKDIPGYKAGEIFDWGSGLLSYTHSPSGELDRCILYSKKELIDLDFAEEVKDEIDMKEIRKQYEPSRVNWGAGRIQTYSVPKMTLEECEWFTAYRIVKAVIEKLNAGEKDTFEIYYVHKNLFSYHGGGMFQKQTGFLPMMASEDIAQKVIELCRPELEVLFGAK